MTLLELLKLMRKYLALVLVFPLVSAGVTAAVCWGVLQSQYTATVSVYVLSARDDAAGSNATAYSDLTASQLMANDVSTLAESETVQKKTADSLGMDSLEGYKIEVRSSTTTRVIDISVTGNRADVAAVVANETASVLSTVAQEVMHVESVNVIDEAKAPVSPSGPPRALYTAVAFLGGVLVAIALVVLLDLLNTRVRTVEEAEELLGVPVIGRIPTMRG